MMHHFSTKLTMIFFTIAITLLFSLIPASPARASGRKTAGKFVEDKGIPIFCVDSPSGSYYEAGKAHAVLLRSVEKDVVEKIKKFINREKLAYSDMDIEYRVDVLEKRLPDKFRQEMRGFADGIDGVKNGGEITYKDVAFTNLVGDVTRANVMCTGASFNGKITGDGKVLIGRNLDWIDRGTFHRVSGATVMRIGKTAFASFGMTGVSTATTGVNSHGLFTAVLSAIQPQDSQFRGHDSVIFTIRSLLEDAESVNDAVEILKDKNFTYSCIFLLGDGKQTLIMEKSGKNYELRQGTPGISPSVTLITNHFLNLKDVSADKDSRIRYNDLEAELKKLSPPLGVQSMKKLLTLCKNPRNPIYRELTGERINRLSTLMSVIFKPGTMDMWIWFARKIPAGKKLSFSKINMKKYLAGNGN